MRGVICQKPSDLAEKLTCEPETDIRHCAASPELRARRRHSLRMKVPRAAERLLSHRVKLYFATAAKVRFPLSFPDAALMKPRIMRLQRTAERSAVRRLTGEYTPQRTNGWLDGPQRSMSTKVKPKFGQTHSAAVGPTCADQLQDAVNTHKKSLVLIRCPLDEVPAGCDPTVVIP